MIHRLKTHPEPYTAVMSGLKRFEFRVNDRGFALGDTLRLEEYDPETKDYTGRTMLVKVTYILYELQYGIPIGYCLMSIVPEE